jgi:hypothetical protein
MASSMVIVPFRNKITARDIKKGRGILKTRPFIAGVVRVMTTSSMANMLSQFKCEADWKVFAIYCKLYADLDAYFVKTYGYRVPGDVAAFTIHSIMSQREYRTVLMKPEKKRKKKSKKFHMPEIKPLRPRLGTV